MKDTCFPLTCLVVGILSLLFIASCFTGDGDDDDDDDLQSEIDDDDATSDDDAGADCTMEELCLKGVDCGGWADMEECTTEWETAIGQCSDPDGFFNCNCECVNQTSECNTILDCGAGCTIQHCL
jgi:hypothetical protein